MKRINILLIFIILANLIVNAQEKDSLYNDDNILYKFPFENKSKKDRKVFKLNINFSLLAKKPFFKEYNRVTKLTNFYIIKENGTFDYVKSTYNHNGRYNDSFNPLGLIHDESSFIYGPILLILDELFE
ncbi:MAG: hypothetical protein HRT66_05945 [Flavobacteriaceae bacterium]|nr:hypothetical protein [Flavobacteriaceae bacterium]